MSILTPEIPSIYGALDSAAFVDGDPSDAAVLRAITLASNRLLCRGEPIVQFIYSSATDLDDALGTMLGWGFPFWVPITPGPITRPKMPGIQRAKLFVRFKLRADEVCYIQVHTAAMPFDPTRPTSAANTIELVGTGSDAWASLADVPLDYGDVEYVQCFLRGEMTATAGDTATYGAPNTGTIAAIIQPNLIRDTSSTWNVTGNTWASGGHGVVIEDGSGRRLTEPRLIRGVIDGFVVGQALQVYPDLDPGFWGTAYQGATYRIFELPRWRIQNIALYAQDRTV